MAERDVDGVAAERRGAAEGQARPGARSDATAGIVSEDIPAAVAAALESERADVLAYLDRKIANAALVIAKTPEFGDEAQQMQRAWSVARDDIAHGLHEGECLKALEVAA